MSKRKRAEAGSAPMPYFSLRRSLENKTVDIYIFGDIVEQRGWIDGLLQPDSDQSSYDLANQIAGIPEDCAITVHINSYGGEVKEGLGIYNVLKSRDVTTICEGFAASAGSVVFCAGKRRIMQPASLLFIHKAQNGAWGSSDDLEKAAEDLRIVTSAAVEAYREAGVTVPDKQLEAMMKAETWITPEEAVDYGFATQVAEDEADEDGVIVNDAMRSIMAAVKGPEQRAMTLPAQLEMEDESGLLDTLRAFTDAIERHEGFIVLAKNVLEKMEGDEDLRGGVMAIVQHLLNNSPAPKAPAPAGDKGFFGFAR